MCGWQVLIMTARRYCNHFEILLRPKSVFFSST